MPTGACASAETEEVASAIANADKQEAEKPKPNWVVTDGLMTRCSTCNMAWMTYALKDDCKCFPTPPLDIRQLCKNPEPVIAGQPEKVEIVIDMRVKPTYEDFDVVYIGSRSKSKNTMKVNGGMTIAQFKDMIFQNFHGVEFEKQDEVDYTANHYIKTAKGGKLLMDNKTFAYYDIQKHTVPWELTLAFTLDSGGKRVSLTEPH